MRIHRDELIRRLYANDASMYEELPEAVAFPRGEANLQELVRMAGEQGTHLTARAGGTSLAGQTTGSGIIMDVSRYMTCILELNPEHRQARVQPGVIRDQLNRQAARHGLMFGPDTSTTDRCMLGGMIGNNSSGAYSIKYGTTRQHVQRIRAVLSDGSTAEFRPLDRQELEAKQQQDDLEGAIYRGMLQLLHRHREQIQQAYPHPDLIRRNTGYALDALCEMDPVTPGGRPFNLCELLCGSEGTLAITAEARVNLVPVPRHQVLLIPQFETLDAAMQATVKAVEHQPAAVELLDDHVLQATRGNIEQQKNRFFLEGDPRCLLIIEFKGDDAEELQQRAGALRKELQSEQLGYAFPLLDNPERMGRVWALRKAGLGLLMGMPDDAQTPTFVEDTAVPVHNLPGYIRDFQALLRRYGTDCVFYAHASVGELHLRPMLNLKQSDNIATMQQMADEVADLVKTYRGSLSGEHGDGRARSPNIARVLGEETVDLLRRVKRIWDPYNRLNPGKIVDPRPMDEDLRVHPGYQTPRVDTLFKWRREGGFGQALELCNGAGVCRRRAESGGTMCPSYMATLEEKDSTRGRANVFRQIFASRQGDGFASSEVREALELCLSCKACKSECPANVDMARMKAEFMHGWHRHHGISLPERFFGDPGHFYALAARFPVLVNAVNHSRPGREVLYQLFGVHRERRLPAFARQTFMSWWRQRHAGDRQAAAAISATPDLVLAVDPFTHYHEPQTGRAAVEVLETLGYSVHCLGPLESGRTQLSKGLLDRARKRVHRNLALLGPYAERGIPVVGLEPSELLTFRDENMDLCEDHELERARTLSHQSRLFEEFLADNPGGADLQKHLAGQGCNVHIHTHCHASTLADPGRLHELLKKTGAHPVEMQTGCCGMAGSFGYEAGHYRVSMDIGELALFPYIRSMGSGQEENQGPDSTGGHDLVCSHGFSCRHQILDGTGRTSLHPTEVLKRFLV